MQVLTESARDVRRRRLRLDVVWFLAVTVVPGMVMFAPRLSTVDLAYAVRAGQLMFRDGGVLRTDPFGLVTAGRPWLNQQWGSQLLFAGVYAVGGWASLVVLRAALVSCVSALVFAACRARGATTRWAGVATLASFLVAIGQNLRAELLGLVLFASVIWILTTARARPGRLWFIPAVVVLWANVHGSFVLAPVLIVLAMLAARESDGRWDRRLAIVGLLAVAATCVTPFGAGVWPYALGLTTDPRIRDLIVEWSPTTLRTGIGVLFFTSIALVAVLLATAHRRPSATTLAYLGVFFFIGVYALRGVAWWAVAVPAAVAPLLPRAEPTARPRAESPALNGLVVTVLAVAVVALLPWWRQGDDPSATLLSAAPVDLTAEYRSVAEPGDRVLNPQPLGSWFEFAVPDVRTFVDSRIEVPPERVWIDYATITGVSSGWQAALARWRFDVVVTQYPREERLANALRTSPCWRESFRADEGSVFVAVRGSCP